MTTVLLSGKPSQAILTISNKTYMKMKEALTKIMYLVLLAGCLLGAIGGFGYCWWCHQYPFAVGIAILAYTAWPQFKKYFWEIQK